MRVDDGMAMVFDSDILEEEVEILGYPEFEVEFTLISQMHLCMLS